MIFVTVGTHEQPFDRLVKYLDQLKEQEVISEEIIIQTGFCTYEPKYCKHQKLFAYSQMQEFVRDARIIITHGAPASFIMPLQIGKIPVVVPRQKEFGEHVNDHQLDFCSAVSKRMGNIILIDDISILKDVLLKYDTLAAETTVSLSNNNERFNIEFEKLINKIM